MLVLYFGVRVEIRGDGEEFVCRDNLVFFLKEVWFSFVCICINIISKDFFFILSNMYVLLEVVFFVVRSSFCCMY